MAINFFCSGCAKPYSVPDDRSGKRLRCPACLAEMVVPGRPLAAPVATAEDVTYACPQCATILKVPGHLMGEDATCPRCKGRTVVPLRSAAATAIVAGPPPPLDAEAMAWIRGPMKVSAVWNLAIGALLTYFVGLAAGMLILGAFEVRFLIDSAKDDGRYYLHTAKVIAIFEIIIGLFTVVPLVCGIIVLINAMSADAAQERRA